MAVLGRLLLGSAERLDLPDLLSIDSFTASDFKYLLQSFVGGDTPYVFSGFDVIQPQDSIGTSSIAIQVANSVVYHPAAGAGSFFYGLEEGNSFALPLTPELRTNATNFVYLTFTTKDTATDSRAFWDPDQNGGEGGEFSQDINTESVLAVEAGVSVSTFPAGTIPVCKVVVGASVITSITDSRDMMFRLGSGGTNPDPFNDFTFRDSPSSAYARKEPQSTMSNALDPNPFKGGDKNIYTLKEWMDVVMTRIKELSGKTYWYEGLGISGPTLGNVFIDALGSKLWSKGSWQFTGATTDTVEWTEDIRFQTLVDPREYFFRSSSIQLPQNGDIAWFPLVRDSEINTSTTAADWINAANYVNTETVGTFENLEQGDWIKKKADSPQAHLRVEQFYSGKDMSGGPTTAALALSVELSSAYTGTTSSEISVYSKGDYNVTDMLVTQADDPLFEVHGGNAYWMSCRADTVVNVDSIVPTVLTLSITEADGQRARVTETVLAGHGLIDGDRVEITTGTYAGVYQVEVETATEFFIETPVVGDDVGTAFYAIVTTAARVSTPAASPTITEESAVHGIETNQTVVIASTSSLYDGSYLASTRSDTTFQIPYNAATPNPALGIVEVPRIHVRTSISSVALAPGEVILFDDMDVTNLLTYVGMESITQTNPTYFNPLGYNALQGHQNYNSSPTDNLTERASKLTAMMADRVQDRGLTFTGRVSIYNESAGADQQITASSAITIHKPSSPDQFIDLAALIPANSVAVANIDRDGGSAITLAIESLGNQHLLEENKLIMFYRFADTTVYDWNGNAINTNGSINTDYPEDSQNKNITVVNPGGVDLEPRTEELFLRTKAQAEISQVWVQDANSISNSSYFLLWSGGDEVRYYVWYNIDASGIDPQITYPTELAGAIGIEVAVLLADDSLAVALKTQLAIVAAAPLDFAAGNASNLVTITNLAIGTTTNTQESLLASTGFAFETTVEGSTANIEIVVHGAANNNFVDVAAISALNNFLLPAGHSVWVRIDRTQQKIFNTVATADVPDTALAGTLYITPTTAVPIDQDVFVLWARVGARVIEMHKAVIASPGIYEEEIEIVLSIPSNDKELQTPVAAGTTIILPRDTRNTSRVRTYIVGSSQLDIFLNGQRLTLDEDFSEIGVAGCESTMFNIDQPLVFGDFLLIRVETKGISVGTGIGVTLVNEVPAFTHLEITSVLSPFSASPSDQIVADASAGNMVVNLPPGIAGDVVRIIDGGDGGGSFSTNMLTVFPDGVATIQGNTTLDLTVDGQWVELIYSASQSDWRILG